METLNTLLSEIRSCAVCTDSLELGPNPIVSVSQSSKILIVGQAPGIKVHQSSIPWDDASGKNLRKWMGIERDVFYDNSQIGIMPMGFCYPGKGKSGDLPPRKECADLYHNRLLQKLNKIKLTLLIGQYAQNEYLGDFKKTSLTETVRSYKDYLPDIFCLPHPSPRNNIWQRKNQWFQNEVLPDLKKKVQSILMTN